MINAALVLAGLAAAVHVFIFYLESIAWTSRRARAVFGTTAEEAETTKFLAFNQGFYNLFLAIVTVAGIVTVALDHRDVGAPLVFAGAGSMVAAAAVLLAASAAHREAAVKQGALPLLAVVLLAIGLATAS